MLPSHHPFRRSESSTAFAPAKGDEAREISGRQRLAREWLLCGCGHHGRERAIVSGRVTYQDQPLRFGQIHFRPVDNTTLPMSAVLIQNDNYIASVKGGVPVGTYKVQIMAYRDNVAQGKPVAGDFPVQVRYLSEKYNSQTELQITIPSGSGSIVQDFDLTN